MIYYVLVAVLMMIGLYGLFVKRNLLKKILGLVIVESAVNLFLILVGYRTGGAPPILEPGGNAEEFARTSVDPLPQALVLTSIVIGLGVVMLMVALAHRIHQRYGTLDTIVLHRLRG